MMQPQDMMDLLTRAALDILRLESQCDTLRQKLDLKPLVWSVAHRTTTGAKLHAA